MPWTAAAIVIGGLSLMGVPLTAGFIAKWYLLQAFIAEDLWWMVAVLVLGSLLGAVYLWRLLAAIWFRQPGNDAPLVSEAPAGLLISTWVLIALNVFIGVHAQPLADLAHRAAEVLF